MTATIAEPVADTEVLTALDFATPPVEVKTSVVDNKVVYTMPPGAILTISASNVTWSVPEGEVKFEMSEVKADTPIPSFDDLYKSVWAAKAPQQCGCGMCQPAHTGSMNPTAKALWVEALRDPSRKQGRGALRRGDLWCALGVLIDVAMQAGVEVAVSMDVSGATVYDGYGGALPPSVLAWAGLRGNPIVDGVGVAALNDMGRPLAQIADRIEACL